MLGCGNKHAPKRNYCHKHRIERFKQNNPVKYCFFVVRQNAKRRGKDWELTFRQFAGFVDRTNYMKLKGKTVKSLTIDRKKNDQGYHRRNIQAITLLENSRKGDRFQYTDYYQTMMRNASHSYAE